MNRIKKLYAKLGKELQPPGVHTPSSLKYPGLTKLGKVITVKFKQTFVVSVAPNGTIELNTGGWRTPAVRAKLNKFLSLAGWGITQELGAWYLVNELDKKRYPFSDHMIIQPSGKVIASRTLQVKPIEAAARGSHPMDVSRAINAFAKEYCNSWANSDILPPSPSDPWSLYQLTLGPEKSSVSPSELKLHIKAYIVSKYFFGSLLAVALQDADGEDTELLSIIDKLAIERWLASGKVEQSKFTEDTVSNLRTVLKRYLYRVFEKELAGTER